MVMQEFSKQPAETYTIGIPFAGKLPTGTTVVSGTVSATDPAGTDVTGTVLGSAVVAVVNNEARVRVLAGEHGVEYRLRFVVTLDNSDVLEEDVLMTVENL
jgi:hypothetical protein